MNWLFLLGAILSLIILYLVYRYNKKEDERIMRNIPPVEAMMDGDYMQQRVTKEKLKEVQYGNQEPRREQPVGESVDTARGIPIALEPVSPPREPREVERRADVQTSPAEPTPRDKGKRGRPKKVVDLSDEDSGIST